MKTGHLAATMTGPAKGKMYPTLWTFAGVENNRDMLGGTKRSYAQKTVKGWPDEETVRIWARMVVKERNSRGIDRCLMLVDNADVHMDPEVNAIFIKNKVVLSGLIKSGTGNQQPLDVDGFGQIKPLAVKIAGELSIKVKDENIAMLAEMAIERLEQRATQKGTSFLAPAFRKAGIVPLNPDIFTDAQMAGSVLATGLTRDHAAVKQAKKTAKVWAKFTVAEVTEALNLADPETSAAYKKGAALTKQRHEELMAQGAVIDPDTGSARYVYTSESFHKHLEAKAAAKAAEEDKVAQAAAVRKAAADKNKAEAKARSKAYQDRLAQNKAAKAQKAAIKAKGKAKKVVKVVKAPVAVPGKFLPVGAKVKTKGGRVVKKKVKDTL